MIYAVITNFGKQQKVYKHLKFTIAMFDCNSEGYCEIKSFLPTFALGSKSTYESQKHIHLKWLYHSVSL